MFAGSPSWNWPINLCDRPFGMYVAMQHDMSTLTETTKAFLFLAISGCLAACFIWAFWEIEQATRRRRLQRAMARHPGRR
jgi:hypothetical protein